MDQNKLDRSIVAVVQQMREEAMKIDDKYLRERWMDTLSQFVRTGDVQTLLTATEFRRQIVDMQTFLYDPFYLGLEEGSIYPRVEEALTTIDSEGFNEVVLMGALGIGKTSIANLGIVRDVYRLSCMRSPQTSYGIQSRSFITFTVQSVRFATAKLAIFNELGSLFDGSQYFQEAFPMDKKTKSRIVFPEHRIQIMPATSSTTGIISMNVIGGLLDEANFMQKISKSKSQFADEQGEFDQAKELYNTLASRRKTRFNKRGKMPGRLYLASSSRYPTDFTQVRAAKSTMLGGNDRGVYVYSYSQWEGKPRSSFMAEEFQVQVGNENYRSKVIQPGDTPDPGARVINVPMDFYQEFLDDPDKSIRDLAGMTVLSVNPFITRRETIGRAFELADKYGYRSPYAIESIDLTQGRPVANLDFIRSDVPGWRVAHIDLGWKKDAAGIAIGHVAGYKVSGGTDDEPISILPVVGIDAIMRVVAPRGGGEIDFSLVRKFLIDFKNKTGIDLKYVTTDGFQSVDTRQILRKQGFITSYQSVEAIESYRTMRDTLYDGRLFVPMHSHLAKELRELEITYHNNKEKADHPAAGSKDLTDAVTGVVQFITSRRSTWSSGIRLDPGAGYHLFGNSESIGKLSSDQRAGPYNVTPPAEDEDKADVEDVTDKPRRTISKRKPVLRRSATRK